MLGRDRAELERRCDSWTWARVGHPPLPIEPLRSGAAAHRLVEKARYRHPDPGLVGGLERAGAAVRRTDLAGDVAVVGGSVDLELVSRGAPLPAPR